MEIRFRAFFLFFIVSLVALTGRLFFWQVVKGQELSEDARAQHVSGEVIQAARGDILSRDDTWLAASRDSWLVFAAGPEIKKSARDIANVLAPFFIDTDSDGQKQALLNEAMRLEGLLSDETSYWIPLKKDVSSDIKKNIEALKIEGIHFDLNEKRLYPEGSMSAQVLGFVGKDEDGNDKGYFGLEGYYDLTLSGKPGFRERELSPLGVPIIFGDAKEISAVGGVDLVTNVDKTVQAEVEKELTYGMEIYGAKSGTVIVMNPNNGAILAMASRPSYDPSHYQDYGDDLFRNPAISDSFEPGSIFKPIVMASGLDAGVVTPDTKCDICSEPLKVDKYFIKTWDDKYHPDTTMTEVIQHSDNVGMAFVGNKLGADRLYDYLDKFGIGHLTGIDLQGEMSPDIRKKGTWNVVDLATTSFGQGIAVTPIQMVKAVGIIANKGIEISPLVVGALKAGGWKEDIPSKLGSRVISEKAAKEITDMMVVAVRDGEAKWAAPKKFKIAGKTGTAQIPVSGHYDANKTIASFIGFAPADDPKFVMLVTLREPQTSPWASETAAPLWFNIAEDLFPYLGIHPQE